MLVCLTGWTNGSIAEILACRPAWLNFQWLGWAAPMYASFIDYMVAGDALTKDQRQLPQGECCALIGCYQPCQAHTYLQEFFLPKSTRECFNFPQNFLFCYPGNTNRLNKKSIFIFWKILTRTPGSCLVLIETRRRKRKKIMKWIQNIDPNFDISRILFRRYLQKNIFWQCSSLLIFA